MLRVKAYAKINLSLKIVGARLDGFHAIESIMQSVSLFDTLTLTPGEAGIQLTTDNLQLTTDWRNLAYKAAQIYFERGKGQGARSKGIKIFLEKNIPLAAGLAGGSADAAGVLFGLNLLAKAEGRMPNAELMNLGSEIGSDVPFCLIGGNCTVKGRGEAVMRNAINVMRHYILVTPQIEVSSKWAYAVFDEMTNDKLQMLNEGTRNDLEPVVIKKYPVVQKIKDKLLILGCSRAQMSGSGPSVFGEVSGEAQGEKIAAEMKKEFPQTFFVQTVDQGVEGIED